MRKRRALYDHTETYALTPPEGYKRETFDETHGYLRRVSAYAMGYSNSLIREQVRPIHCV